MGGKHGYYMLYRAPGPGCQPMDGLDRVVDYGGKKPMPDYNNRGAWGEAWYSRELTAVEQRDYEMMTIKGLTEARGETWKI